MFNKVDKDEVNNLANDAEPEQENANNNNKEADDKDIVNNVEQNIKQNDNEQSNNKNNDEDQPEDIETDKESNKESNTCTCNRPETFTYERMRQTHQQTGNNNKETTLSDKIMEQIEQCHNLMTSTDLDTVEYNPNLAPVSYTHLTLPTIYSV